MLDYNFSITKLNITHSLASRVCICQKVTRGNLERCHKVTSIFFYIVCTLCI